MDVELRAGNKGQTDEELETTLDKALMLFRYISVSPSPPTRTAQAPVFTVHPPRPPTPTLRVLHLLTAPLHYVI